jgi:hypothetical protein
MDMKQFIEDALDNWDFKDIARDALYSAFKQNFENLNLRDAVSAKFKPIVERMLDEVLAEESVQKKIKDNVRSSIVRKDFY